jgi:hypothetical protein
VLAGRPYAAGASRDAVVVSKHGALAAYGTLDVVGKGFPKGETSPTIVGVADDVRLAVTQSPEMAEVYWPLQPDEAAALLVTAKSDPLTLLAPLREASRAADVRVVPDIRLMREDFARELQIPRLTSSIASLLALIGVGLAAVGIFGIVLYTTVHRMKEIGIRLALGATRASTVRLLVGRTLVNGIGGVGLGLAGSWAAGKAFAGEPFHLQPLDVRDYILVAFIFLSIAAVAALLPVARTLSQDPLRTLKHE